MSFHSTLTGATVWPADLVTAGVVTAAPAVYTGRTRQVVTRTDSEVWLERLPAESAGTGLQRLERVSYLVHVIEGLALRGGAQAGKEQLDALEAKLETIRRRYDGARPFTGDLPEIVHARAEEADLDVDPEGNIEGTVRVTFLVKG